MYKWIRQQNAAERQTILSTLPFAGDKSSRGLTRKQIVERTNMPPSKVSYHLQVLKTQGKVKCYRLRWRQAVSLSKLISSLLHP